MATTREQTLLLGTFGAIGTFAIGKAAVDHHFETRRLARTDADFEEQHYRAAGFIRRGAAPDHPLNDVVAFGAAIFGLGVVIAGIPKIIEELAKL